MPAGRSLLSNGSPSGRSERSCSSPLALAVYGVRAIGWPLIAGRDLDEYLYGYIQFLDWHPLLPWSMLFRTPVTPIVAGTALDVARRQASPSR